MSVLTRLIESHWQQPRLWLTCLLYPLSRLFQVVAGLRTALYRSGCLKSVRLNVPVIVVGNLHAGGVGKTPVTAALAQSLRQQGIRVGIVSRGYGRESQETLLVDVRGDAADYGDEPLLLAQKTGVPLAVGRDRAAAAQLLLQHFPATQIILSDDGLQHYRLARDMEIVVFPAGDARRQRLDVLPNGPLREPLSRLRDADALIISNDEQHVTPTFRLPEKVCLYRSRLFQQDFYALNQPERTVAADFFAGKKVVALAAIARPQRFFNTLAQLNIHPTAHIALPDHAALSADDIPSDADIVLVTEKDAVKLARFALPQVWVLPVYAIITPDLSAEIISRYVR
ncbi:MAG: tetraacyldisaccharide 4'-kinase [Neisseria sp.]|nr:tetraacyldisaccharide 4'-kinase [Neisseria sp.]